MPFTSFGKRLTGLFLVVASLALMAAPAAIAQTSVVTQEDCDAGRITRNGEVVRGEECEDLIGQRVNLADTGLDVWVFGVAGVIALGGAVVLLRRRRPVSTARLS